MPAGQLGLRSDLRAPIERAVYRSLRLWVAGVEGVWRDVEGVERRVAEAEPGPVSGGVGARKLERRAPGLTPRTQCAKGGVASPGAGRVPLLATT